MSKKCGRLVKKLRCIQAIDASAWLCFTPGSVISEMVEKNESGSTELSEEFANGPTFNTEDLINSMQLFSDIVSFFLLLRRSKGCGAAAVPRSLFRESTPFSRSSSANHESIEKKALS